MIPEYASAGHRLAAVALAYTEKKDRVIVVASDVTERRELTQLIRDELRLTAAQQHSHHGKVTDAAKIFAVGLFQKQLSLIAVQPVSQTGSQLLHTFDSADPGGKLRAQRTGICGLIRESPHCRKALIYRSCSQSEGFEVQEESENDGSIWIKARFGAIPSDELLIANL